MTTTQQQAPARLVFRTPATAVLGALLFVVTATPFAFAAPWLFLVYLVPLGAIAAVLRLRTTADGDGLVARTLLGRHELAWTDIRALRVSERSWLRAVLTDGREQILPTVRTRHLPALALISGGRLTDPTEPADHPTDTEPADTERAEVGRAGAEVAETGQVRAEAPEPTGAQPPQADEADADQDWRSRA